MIVEFIGCTGSGKTTLITEVQRRIDKRVPITTSVELAAGFLGLRGVTNPTLQNLIQEFVSFPFFILSLHRYKEFLRYTVKLFLRNSHFSLHTINNLRSLERKLGMYEIMSRASKDPIILVDEGPLLAAHMFVFTGATYTPEEIAQFAALVPLPNLIVYVRAPVDTLIKRTLQRSDAPREINKKDLEQIERYTKRAVSLFDQLADTENIRCRLLIAESLDFSEQGYGTVAEEIAESILNRRLRSDPRDNKTSSIRTAP